MTDTFERLKTALAGRYAIEHELGAGGMATVYLAEDLKHHRKVAVKVLRPELAAVLGAERFVQEIKTTANLQHPHILPLFDSGEADSFLYYVMPYVEGETLRDKLNRETQLGIEEAVKITTEVADALDYAHRHNVIHRDIKPENILLHDGRPMVADFGIALAVSAAAGGRMTETGLSLGTPHYMSPEQATAEKNITHRSDIYSLGCVLYEMLTGDPPHTGSSAQQIIMKIVAEDVQPVLELRKSVPPHVAAATAQALEKLPADRFTSAAKFGEALTNPAFTLPATQATAVAGAPTRGPWNRLSITTTALATTVLAVVALWALSRPTPGVLHLSVPIAAEQGVVPTGNGTNSVTAISPDGEFFVYAGFVDATKTLERQLYKRRFDQPGAQPIPGTMGGAVPFFSPDGRWLGFYAGNALKKVPLEGGAPLTIVEVTATGMLGASWGTNDTIVFAPSGRNPLWQVPASGGGPTPLTVLDSAAGELGHWWPHHLPDGNTVLFGRVGRGDIAALSLATGDAESVVPANDGNPAIYLPSGHLLFVRGSIQQGQSLFAASFDLDRVQVEGEPIKVLEGLPNGGRNVAVSGNGSLLFLKGGGVGRSLVFVSLEGTEEPVCGGSLTLEGGYPRFSPDGRRIATDGVWVHDLVTCTSQHVTVEGTGLVPSWSPDGKRIAYGARRPGTREGGGEFDLFWRPADGSGTESLLVRQPWDQYGGVWAPDGRSFFYTETRPNPGDPVSRGIVSPSALWLWRWDFDAKRAVRLNEGQLMTTTPAVSPDGNWLAFEEWEGARKEVYVARLSDEGLVDKRRIATDGATAPLWSPSGDELFYRRGSQVVAVRLQLEPTFRVLGEEVLFEGPYAEPAPGVSPSYDIDPNGDRFVMVRLEPVPPVVHVVFNWFEELKALVGNE